MAQSYRIALCSAKAVEPSKFGGAEGAEVKLHLPSCRGVGQDNFVNSVVVIVVVPILLVMPLVCVFIPPAMIVLPAIMARVR